jgi:ABC-type transport system involved in multi-copper enzyme maturation permease subunit
MTFLAIVERELKVRSRQKSTFRIRMAGALAASLFAGMLLVFTEVFMQAGQAGMFIFKGFTFLAFIFCLTEGVRTTADCLSREKREGTLGLLFLTDLKGYDVVLGKLMATSLNSIYVLLGIFPALAVPLTLGGVTGGEVWRVSLVLLHTLILSLSLGMVISALVRKERTAWVMTLLLMLAMTLVPLILNWLGLGMFPAYFSPATAMGSAFDREFQTQATIFHYSLAALLGMAVTCLGIASVLLPRRWQDEPQDNQPGPTTPRTRSEGLQAGSFHAPRNRQQLQLDSNPVVWLAALDGKQSGWLWMLIISVCGGAIVLTVGSQVYPALAWPLLVAALVTHMILALWIALHACHALATSRNSGALEILLSTPLSDKEIVQGHWLALKRLFYRPVMTLAMVELVLLSAFMLRHSIEGAEFLECLLLFAFFGLLLFTGFLDMLAVGRFGLWMGLKWNKPGQALTRTILYVLAIPMVFACCYFLWPLVGPIKNLVFLNYGNDQLRRNFRQTASQPPGTEMQGHQARPTPSSKPKNPLPPVTGI